MENKTVNFVTTKRLTLELPEMGCSLATFVILSVVVVTMLLQIPNNIICNNIKEKYTDISNDEVQTALLLLQHSTRIIVGQCQPQTR